MAEFQRAVKAFEDASPWLGDADLPALVALRKMAQALDDGEMAPAMLSQFGLCFRDLRKREPKAEQDRDPLEDALEQADA